MKFPEHPVEVPPELKYQHDLCLKALNEVFGKVRYDAPPDVAPFGGLKYHSLEEAQEAWTAYPKRMGWL